MFQLPFPVKTIAAVVLFTALCGCSTAGPVKKSNIPPFKIFAVVTARDVKTSGSLSQPVNPTKIFTAADEKVVSHIRFKNLTGTHQLRWDWYTPKGKLFHTTGDFAVKARPGTFINEGAACSKFNLKKKSALDQPGDWQVKIFVDGALAEVDHFSLQRSGQDENYADIYFGEYHAVVIGNNNYQSLPKLKCARKDAEDVARVLAQEYRFDVKLMLDATRSDIVTTLDDLRGKLTPKDNLLIYYAGHGWLDRPADEGYWLPVDAVEDSSLNWISNSQITSSLKAIQAKHILVVADSCYAGKLTRDIKRGIGVVKTKDHYLSIANRKVRSVLCSGGLEPVGDSGGKTDHSVFAAAFIKVLEENEAILDGLELFNKLRRPVMLNADQTPEYSDIRKAGHDGGDFLFVRRN